MLMAIIVDEQLSKARPECKFGAEQYCAKGGEASLTYCRRMRRSC
jgi:hypothetical protein